MPTRDFLRPITLVVLLSVATMLALVPYASNLVFHFPDERYYSDGGMAMLETGDFLTPHTAAGDVRIRKPPAAYWLSAAGMAIFGTNVFGSRVAWLVISAAAIILTYTLGRAAGANCRTAALGSVILAGNLVFLRGAVNAVPDQLLMLGILVAAIGFVGLMTRDDMRDGWVAYGGIGLAILAKGLLPLALVAWTFVYLLLVPRLRPRLAKVWQSGPALVGFGIPASWFVYQRLVVGEAAGDFLYDQVTEKVGIRLETLTQSFLSSVAGLVVPVALILIAFVLASVRTRSRPNCSELGLGAWYFAGWIGIVVFVFLFTLFPSHRYILPAVPFVCLLAAAALQSLSPRAVNEALRIVYRIALVFCCAAVLMLLGLATALLRFWQVALLAGIAYAGAVLVWRQTKREDALAMSAAMAVVPYGMGLMVFPFISALLLPDLGQPFARRLAEIGAPPAATLFVGHDLAASKIRLHTGRTDAFAAAGTLPDTAELKRFSVVLTEEETTARRLEAMGFEVSEVRGGWRDFRGSNLREAIIGWDLTGGRERQAEMGYLLTRPPEE